MKKKDLLDILYLERERLKSIYQLPGWSAWVIIATIVTLTIKTIDIIIIYDINIRFASAITFSLLNLIFTYSFTKGLFKKNNEAIFDKNSIPKNINLSYITTILILQLSWLTYSKEFIYNELFYYSSLISLIYLIIIYLVSLFLGFFKTLKDQKPDKIAFLYPILFIINLTTISIYIIQYKHTDNLIENYHVGIYIFIIVLLLIIYNNEYSNKLKDIDSLIEKTLYCKEVNESLILDELEHVTLGNRFGKFLINDVKNYITDNLTNLFEILISLYSILNKTSTIKKYDKDIDTLVTNMIYYINNTEDTLKYLKEMSSLAYYKTDTNIYKTRMDDYIYTTNEILKYFICIKNDYNTKRNLQDFANKFITTYNNIFITKG